MNLTLIARALGSASLALVGENFEAFLPVGLLFFECVAVPDDVGEEPGLRVVLVALVLLRPPLCRFEVSPILGKLGEVSG